MTGMPNLRMTASDITDVLEKATVISASLTRLTLHGELA